MSDHEPEKSREQRFERQTKEQYEALGRFVQEFEQMVDAARFGCLMITAGNGREQQRMNIVLHHSALSAMPMFEIFRALLGTIIYRDGFDIAEQKIFTSVIKDVHERYRSVASKRNDLIHATWYIGWASEDQQDFSEFLAKKHKVTGDQLKLAKNPTNTTELELITQECSRLNEVIRALFFCGAIGLSAAKNFAEKDVINIDGKPKRVWVKCA